MPVAVEQFTKDSQASAKATPAAQLKNVTKNYGSVQALQHVNLDIFPGELLALLGPNGAGKTTAVKLLLGLLKPSTGMVRVFGGDPARPETRRHIGAMLQDATVPETLRVREHIDLFSSYYAHPLALRDVLAITDLEAIQHRKVADLSGGQKQRLLFALALCGNPDILFLDEPTVGLDVEGRRVLWEQIRKLLAAGKTILLTTHYLEEADALANHVVVINKGQIVAHGTPADIKAQTSGRRIRCITALSVDDVRAIPGVANVNQDREALEIQTSKAEPIVRELMARDPGLSGLEVASAGLEDAFLALTRSDNNDNQESRN
jgi:ABC-2 type transport system ATP-binding protein